MDTLTPAERSALMSRIRSKNTRPEMIVRRLAHSLGYRFRLHVRTVPGCPDLVFAPRKAVILVHGCFWHQHSCPMGDRLPKSRRAYWRRKLDGNRRRDERNRRALRAAGWRIMVVWECQTRRPSVVRDRIIRFLG
jgi:DNA mismatch endonuclease (patch repair protein)